MSPEINAIILAGGRGSRMGELTSDTHKSMLYIEGKPIVAHILDGIQEEFGSANIIIATGYKAESIHEKFGGRYGKLDINYVHNPNSLEIRKRLLLAEGIIKGPFFVIGTDVIVNPNHYSNMVHKHNTDNKEVYGVISGAVDLNFDKTD